MIDLIYTSIVLLFFVAAASIYALIVSRKNYIITFLLTPALLVASIFAGYTMFMLQGTPINGIPEGNVEVVWVEMAKPEILFLARPETGGRPYYYVIPYNDNNRDTMQEIMKEQARKEQRGEESSVPGRFKTGEKQDDPSEMNVEFVPPEGAPLPPKQTPSSTQGWQGF